MDLQNTIQEALDDVGRHEQLISRAEADIATDISNKALEIIADLDFVTEGDKLSVAIISIEVARSIVDWVSSGLGTGHSTPRHILAETLANPSNRQHLVNHGTKSLMRQIETSIMKRARLRNEKFEYERRNEQPRNIEIAPIRTDGGVMTSAPGFDAQPTPSHTVPVLEYGSAPRNKDVDLHGNDFSPRGRDYPAKRNKRK